MNAFGTPSPPCVPPLAKKLDINPLVWQISASRTCRNHRSLSTMPRAVSEGKLSTRLKWRYQGDALSETLSISAKVALP